MIVLDASALVDVLIDQPNKPAVIAHLDQKLMAPAHQPIEVLSAIARLRRAGELNEETARRAIREASELVQEFVHPDARLMQHALELDGRIRVVDAVYVALAEQLDCPLLTSDQRLEASNPPCKLIVISAIR